MEVIVINYYIDFEATQFSNEIISIGAIREDGETFYSLVAPVEGKITPFITNLTGITKEMVETAMSPDIVFENFSDWVFGIDNIPNFLVWGDSDVDFLRHTFKRTNSMKARMIIGYMSGSIRDYSKDFKKKCGAKNLSLIKAMNMFDPEAEQNHHALDDAILLYNVHKYENYYTPAELKQLYIESLPVEEKTLVVKNISNNNEICWSRAGYPVGTLVCVKNPRGAAVHAFKDRAEAARWLYENKVKFAPCKTKLETVSQNIKKAIGNGKPYYNFYWRRTN